MNPNGADEASGARPGAPPKSRSFLPGATVGIFGGGQLGRMTAIEARRLGFGVRVFDPEPGGPAAQVADSETLAAFGDRAAARAFAASVDVATYEFENIPAATVDAAAELCPVRPGTKALHICQDREREKCFLRDAGVACAPFQVVTSEGELASALRDLPQAGGVLKTAGFGYDGKGQVRVHRDDDASAVWGRHGGSRAVLETWVEFEKEISVVCARGIDGETAAFPAAENLHANHILDWSIAPARIAPDVAERAAEIAVDLAARLDVAGLLAVEFFMGADGSLAVNEMAPRPHNSGHYTLDACETSQFEQHVRAVCGLPLGSTELRAGAAVMGNLLGDLWDCGEPDWAGLLSHPRAKLHLYGKSSHRPGRKMGHFCVTGRSVDETLADAVSLRRKIARGRRSAFPRDRL